MAYTELEIGAVIVDHMAFEAGHQPILDGELDIVDTVATVGVARRDVVDPVLYVFHRAAAGARQCRRDDHHPMREDLAAEAAAGEGRHDVQPMGRDAEARGDEPADIVVHRGIGVDRELAATAPTVSIGCAPDRAQRS